MNKGTIKLLNDLHENENIEVSVIFDTDSEFDRLRSNETVYEAYECTVIFDGALDETFVIATDNLAAVNTAMVADIEREYADNPTSWLGWSIEWYELDYELTYPEGADPIMQRRFSPDPV